MQAVRASLAREETVWVGSRTRGAGGGGILSVYPVVRLTPSLLPTPYYKDFSRLFRALTPPGWRRCILGGEAAEGEALCLSLPLLLTTPFSMNDVDERRSGPHTHTRDTAHGRSHSQIHGFTDVRRGAQDQGSASKRRTLVYTGYGR